MEKYGFVYIWYDRKHKRFYIGSHWQRKNINPEIDKYICSSNSMREAYRRRPEDFKRRIIKRIYTNHKDLLTEEQRWLDMIPREEFGKKYYNKNFSVHFFSWWANEDTKKEVSEKIKNSNSGPKISKALKGKYVGIKNAKYGIPRTKEWIKWFKENHPRPTLGKKQDPEVVKRRAESIKKAWKNMTDNHKENISKERRSRRHSSATKEKMRQSALLREQKKIGIKWD